MYTNCRQTQLETHFTFITLTDNAADYVNTAADSNNNNNNSNNNSLHLLITYCHVPKFILPMTMLFCNNVSNYYTWFF